MVTIPLPSLLAQVPLGWSSPAWAFVVLGPVVVLIGWSVGCAWLADRLCRQFWPDGAGQLVAKVALLGVLLPLPVLDEWLDQPGCQASCTASARAAPAPPRGRLARLLDSPTALTFNRPGPAR